MTDQSSERDRELARAALRRGAAPGEPAPRCSCFNERGRIYGRGCVGLCEDAVDHVSAAIAKARAQSTKEG